MTKVDVRGMNWVDANYDIVPTENGEFYQFYEKVNTDTGEKAYMVAKYLNDADYMTEEEAKEILGEHFNR